MNIFFLDKDPKLAAQYHCNSHCCKMILESAQMLSTAHRIIDNNTDERFYKATHINHPCNKWIRESAWNYVWLFLLFKNLCKEYTYRYNKIHKCESMIPLLESVPIGLTNKWMTLPALAMPEEYKTCDVINSYRQYYKFGKTRLLKYTKRNLPEWL